MKDINIRRFNREDIKRKSKEMYERNNLLPLLYSTNKFVEIITVMLIVSTFVLVILGLLFAIYLLSN